MLEYFQYYYDLILNWQYTRSLVSIILSLYSMEKSTTVINRALKICLHRSGLSGVGWYTYFIKCLINLIFNDTTAWGSSYMSFLISLNAPIHPLLTWPSHIGLWFLVEWYLNSVSCTRISLCSNKNIWYQYINPLHLAWIGYYSLYNNW